MKTSNIKTGCKFHDDCFTCPLPDCGLDNITQSKRRMLEVEAVTLLRQGHSLAKIAAKMSRGPRQIQRYLKKSYDN